MTPDAMKMLEQCMKDLFGWALHSGWHEAFERIGYKLTLEADEPNTNVIVVKGILHDRTPEGTTKPAA